MISRCNIYTTPREVFIALLLLGAKLLGQSFDPREIRYSMTQKVREDEIYKGQRNWCPLGLGK